VRGVEKTKKNERRPKRFKERKKIATAEGRELIELVCEKMRERVT